MDLFLHHPLLLVHLLVLEEEEVQVEVVAEEEAVVGNYGNITSWNLFAILRL